MISPAGGRFLEVGCGAGATLEHLKSRGALYVAGIDTNEGAIELASQKGLDFVSVANVESDILPFGEKEFDCIIFADVLEHIYNPWRTLKSVTHYLKDDGCILLSIPNMKYYKVMWRLIAHDEWSYCEAGILDNTHIRFFTLKEIEKLLDFSGLRLSELRLNASAGRIFRLFNILLFNNLRTFSAIQYFIKASKLK